MSSKTIQCPFTAMKFFFKQLQFALFIFLSSCMTKNYKVYNTANVKESFAFKVGEPVILQDAISCTNCVYDILDYYSKKVRVSLIILAPKNKLAKLSIVDGLQDHLNDNTRVYFQHSSKKNNYTPSKRSKLFLEYPHETSPIILIKNGSGIINLYSYSEFVSTIK